MARYLHPSSPEVLWDSLTILDLGDAAYEVALGKMKVPNNPGGNGGVCQDVLAVTVSANCGMIQRTTVFFQDLRFHSFGCTCVHPRYCEVVPDCVCGDFSDKRGAYFGQEKKHLPASLELLHQPDLVVKLPEYAQTLLAGIFS
ncbi:MAG: hypothetical protein COY66_02460 [Candidatus Kerfeldbacteria bacterium CG_4_10_14_0_8_um_filter_42_10]|uniref:Uncharacterized protein n=1 Tax=Candidatus Kerfeldbacteria bacterium CG_4_10_14_0_8_um_filter_42_10 TaxID=2014248 RepID=A0A2M7RJD9_9BACT|nr:MAG: hypothetical protein COY66_02460 [Candidatus Kerfeldbacteria bacterium CG_4_10_14_0_8_um_filter_42_10]